MKVDSLSNECVAISSITLVVSLVLIVIEADYIQVAFAAATLFSILIIFGIKQRSGFLIAPWLLAVLAGVALPIFFLMILSFARAEDMLYIFGIICAESMVLHTVRELFNEMRRDTARKLRRRNQLKGVTVK